MRLRRRRDLAFLAAVWGILCASAQVLANPAGQRHEAAIACGVLLALDLVAWLMPEPLELKMLKLARTKAAKLVIVSLGLALVPAALTERGCRLLTDLHVLKYHQAIQTVWRAGHDDWRMATITGDENREPDPVLLWRPVTHSPFNAQRFKGPLAEIPKPADRLSRDVLRRFADGWAPEGGLALVAEPAASGARAAPRAADSR